MTARDQCTPIPPRGGFHIINCGRTIAGQFQPLSDVRQWTNAPQQTASLFDHLVGVGEQPLWYIDAN